MPFASVDADPASDDARRRCADELGGTPRAELIRLQLGGGRGAAKAATALLKKHANAWLEPLEGALVRSSVRLLATVQAALARLPELEVDIDGFRA